MALFYNTNQGKPMLGFRGFEYLYSNRTRSRPTGTLVYSAIALLLRYLGDKMRMVPKLRDRESMLK